MKLKKIKDEIYNFQEKLGLFKMSPYSNYEIRHKDTAILIATIRSDLKGAWFLRSKSLPLKMRMYELPDVSSYEFKSAAQAFDWVKKYILWNNTGHAQVVKRQKN